MEACCMLRVLAALRSEILKQYLLVAQPLPAEGGKRGAATGELYIKMPIIVLSKCACTGIGQLMTSRWRYMHCRSSIVQGLFDLRAFSQACTKLKASSEYSDGEFSNEIGEPSHTN